MANGIVEALFPYSYEARDERIVSFSAGDRFTLLDKTNDDWWQVQKESEKPIYVPASYMKELIIPIYENMTSISNHPHNGEDRLREQNGRSYESLDKETDVESTVLDRNCNSDSDRNNYQGNGHVVEVFEDSNTVSRSSSGVKSNSLDVKSLANSLESVSRILIVLNNYNQFHGFFCCYFQSNPERVCLFWYLKNQEKSRGRMKTESFANQFHSRSTSLKITFTINRRFEHANWFLSRLQLVL